MLFVFEDARCTSPMCARARTSPQWRTQAGRPNGNGISRQRIAGSTSKIGNIFQNLHIFGLQRTAGLSVEIHHETWSAFRALEFTIRLISSSCEQITISLNFDNSSAIPSRKLHAGLKAVGGSAPANSGVQLLI